MITFGSARVNKGRVQKKVWNFPYLPKPNHPTCIVWKKIKITWAKNHCQFHTFFKASLRRCVIFNPKNVTGSGIDHKTLNFNLFGP